MTSVHGYMDPRGPFSHPSTPPSDPPTAPPYPPSYPSYSSYPVVLYPISPPPHNARQGQDTQFRQVAQNAQFRQVAQDRPTRHDMPFSDQPCQSLQSRQRQPQPPRQPLPLPSTSDSTSSSSPNSPTKETKPAPSQEITWLFFRDKQWLPFDSDNHSRIEQAFTLGGVYVDIKDDHFPDLKCVRVFPTRFYLSYLGMKYRISCVLQN